MQKVNVSGADCIIPLLIIMVIPFLLIVMAVNSSNHHLHHADIISLNTV